MFKTVLQTLLFLLISLLFLTGCDDINVATNIQEGVSLTKNDQTIIFETDHGDAKDVLDIDKRVLTVNGVDRTDNTVTENENTWNFGPLRVVYQPVAPQLLPEGNVRIILTIPSKDIYPTASDFYTKELHIFVDTLAPTIEPLTPNNNTTITDPLTPFIFDIHDNINGSGLDESSVKITFTDTNTSHMLVFDANSNTYRYLPSVTEPFALGNIAFTVYAKDQIGNDASFAGTVTLIDVIPPVLTLNGEANITLEQNENYVELGATATDDRDGNISVEISGSVDTSREGSYALTYTATDSSGNSANVTRLVTVKNKVIGLTLTASQTHFVRQKDTFYDDYIPVNASIKVMGLYSDGHSEEVTDQVKWNTTEGKIAFFTDYFKAEKGIFVVSASLNNLISNEITINVEDDTTSLIQYEIDHVVDSNDIWVNIALNHKPLEDVQLTLKLRPEDRVAFEDGLLKQNYTMVFTPEDWEKGMRTLDVRLKISDANMSNEIIIVTDDIVSNDNNYSGKNPVDIHINREASLAKLIAPSLQARRGAIRGVPIKFRVTSVTPGLEYSLVNPPEGMKVIGQTSIENTEIYGIDVLWDVPMDAEEGKIHVITARATDTKGRQSTIDFQIKVPTTSLIAIEIVSNELRVTDKRSALYGMKMKGHNGEDISTLRLRSVDYKDVWKHYAEPLDANKEIEHIVFVIDNMPEMIDIKFPSYMDTFEKRINIGAGFDRYSENCLMTEDCWNWRNGSSYLYENTNGVSIPHKYKGEINGSKVFIFTINENL
ncbi:hypothetical protein TSL6_17730 [Sulfurovum sp. TSL6]|uniref:DUF5011 domain-containing protein n=1 Tax=Sulfurovum sp. TSL6 TaxID=2826995 RepID=UPI001CC5A3F0|nr:DUF5011 domain-containing protein [Sulfurovum sp. TSL6]GIU01267.1 hypothetical protein TSL6_17730 [Sulfurovum sp. TSL6]